MRSQIGKLGFVLAVLVNGFVPAGDVRGEEVGEIQVWTRPAGDAESAARARRRTVRLGALPTVVAGRRDPQYGATYTFRAVPLTAVLDAAGAPPWADLALLHFANGMVVPLPFRDGTVMKRLDPWLAREILIDGRAQPLPPVTRKAREYVDVPALAFAGNKIVVKEAFHPEVAAGAQPAFSPWAHADALVGVEFVAAAPYYRQFDVAGDGAGRAGFALYRQNCQFCHGARQVGARRGWDLVSPVPVHTYRASGKRLYHHVRFERHDATERGLMMPALKHMTEADAAALWVWLRAIGTTPMPAYAPPAADAR